ncbi:MAG TPA: hypothetical protein VLA88_03120 [Candidatus Saccharimonadales bacterium]|nr:hypothetical protein [Candidatus Saccharimonadales bacterium]
MMPLARKLSTKTKWLLALLGVVLIGAGGYVWYQQSQPKAPVRAPDASTQGGSDKTSLPDHQTVPSSDKVPDKKDATVTIVRLEQKGNEVIIEGDVTGAADGATCVAEFTTPMDNPVNGEAKLVDNNTKCGPITLPAADFAYLGNWSVTLTVYTGGGKAVSSAKTITIK